VSSNFYWLSTKNTEFDWEKTVRSVSTPITSYGDMTRLESLPKVHLTVTAYLRQAKDGACVKVNLKNSSAALAFQVHLAVEAGTPAEEVLPALWEDNYISLLPGEERSVEARFPGKHSIGSQPRLKITGWNLKPMILAIGETGTRMSPRKNKNEALVRSRLRSATRGSKRKSIRPRGVWLMRCRSCLGSFDPARVGSPATSNKSFMLTIAPNGLIVRNTGIANFFDLCAVRCLCPAQAGSRLV
jgi:hypothetical protein